MPSVTVVAKTTSTHSLQANGVQTTFTVSSSGSASGSIEEVDKVVEDACKLSNGKNFMDSHALLAKYTIQSPLNIYANVFDYYNTSITDIDITYMSLGDVTAAPL